MAGNAYSTLAALAAFTFLALAVTSCASSEHVAAQAEPLAPAYKGNGVAEFHDSHIGGDALRERLPGG
jgi:hypothetical protein